MANVCLSSLLLEDKQVVRGENGVKLCCSLLCVCKQVCATRRYLQPQAQQTRVPLTELALLLLNKSETTVAAGGESSTDSLSLCVCLFVLGSSL